MEPVAEAGVRFAVKVTVWPKVEGFADELTVTPAGALLTVWVNTADVLAELFASPLYAAVTECVPTASEETAKVAAPPLTVLVPSTAAPSRNCTLPVAVAGDNFAVNVTLCPKVDGFAEELSVTPAPALETF
jgi:hypothetical protein